MCARCYMVGHILRRIPRMSTSSSVPSYHISAFNIDKSSLRAFSQLHVSKIAVQGTKSDSKLSKELVFPDIVYSQLSYTDIQTTPAYNFLSLVCDISGALGLILGGLYSLLQNLCLSNYSTNLLFQQGSLECNVVETSMYTNTLDAL